MIAATMLIYLFKEEVTIVLLKDISDERGEHRDLDIPHFCVIIFPVGDRISPLNSAGQLLRTRSKKSLFGATADK